MTLSSKKASKFKLVTVMLTTAILVIGCTTTSTEREQNITFLAFGDGGYSVDYPKQKIIKKALNKRQLIDKKRADWLADHRPLTEFDHAPIYLYPDSNIAIEQSGAQGVGLAMATLCQQKKCQFAIQLGDNIYPDGADADDGKDDQKRMDDLILSPLIPLFKVKPDLVVYSALGNHDWKSSRKGVALQTKWMEQQPNFYLEKQGYYSFKKGVPGKDVEFFVLDTNMLLSGQKFYHVLLNPDGSEQDETTAISHGSAELNDDAIHEEPLNGEDIEQLNWLKTGLAHSTARWKVVYGHHILWSIGGTKYSQGHVLRRLILPSLCRYADAYIAGHEHDLELLTDDCSTVFSETQTQNKINNKPVKKLPLIISGAAAKMRGKHTPFAEQQEKRYPEYELLWSKSFTWGFAYIEFNNQSDQLKVSFFSTPKDNSGELVAEQTFSFARRSN